MNEQSSSQVEAAVFARLQKVIDPETNVDVMRMRLVKDIHVDSAGMATYTFHPSSPLCPIAVYLITQIKQAVAEVPGIKNQKITVEGYIAAEELSKLINQEA
jgi:metal-sulfur cluster biosynthetic enzyme